MLCSLPPTAGSNSGEMSPVLAECESSPRGTIRNGQSPQGVPACHRCASPAVGVIALAEIDEGRGADFVSEVVLCVEHLGDVAVACGYARPAALNQLGESKA